MNNRERYRQITEKGSEQAAAGLNVGVLYALASEKEY